MKKIIVIILALALLFCTGCSKTYNTLEDYITCTPDVKEQFEGISDESDECISDVSVEGNILTYSVQYKDQVNEEDVAKLPTVLSETYAEYDMFFKTMIKELEEVTEIDTIKIVVSVCNADGTEIWYTIYE